MTTIFSDVTVMTMSKKASKIFIFLFSNFRILGKYPGNCTYLFCNNVKLIIIAYEGHKNYYAGLLDTGFLLIDCIVYK